jgi:hypothetical protein
MVKPEKYHQNTYYQYASDVIPLLKANKFSDNLQL